ncbi:MAG: response regulator [Elusimicrobia bacterium]|nr:response regulator [Elusimicrobiota bacterium]
MTKTERRILVVDDEPVITLAVQRVCAEEGLRVDTAGSAAEGFALLEKRAYGLIISDIMMAGVDGFDLLLRVASQGIATPVVMVTGFSTVENAVRSMASGAVDFIPKPFTVEELIAVVRRGLRHGELMAKARAAERSHPARPVFTPCPRGCRRLGTMSWVRPDAEGTALAGLCDPFCKTVAGLRRLELAPAGGEVVQGGRFATVVAVDSLAHGAMAPVSGRILEVNARAEARPALVEEDPYGQGWLYRVLPSEPGRELERLISCSSGL